jgi:hypothetical protein
MSSDNDSSNNDVNDDSGNDVEFVHVPNNGLIPATNVITNWGEDGMYDGAKKLRTYYYPPIKDTGFYDSSGNDIGHLFAAAGSSNVDSSYNGIGIWKDSNIAGKQHDSNGNSTFYNQYFSNRTGNDGEVGPHVQFGAYNKGYKWGKDSEGAKGIESSGANWKFDIPTINTIEYQNGVAVKGTQRAKKAVAYIVSSGGSCTGSTKTGWGNKYSSSDGSSGAYGMGKFDIGSSEYAKLHLARDNRANTYVTIGDKTCFIKNGDGGAQERWKSKTGKDVHQVGSSTNDYSNITLISLGKNSRKGVNKVDFPDGHPKFHSDTGRGSGNNSDKPGFVGAIQVHFFWD